MFKSLEMKSFCNMKIFSENFIEFKEKKIVLRKLINNFKEADMFIFAD